MNVLKRIGVPTIFILFTACGSSIPGLDKLKKMCKKDAGLTVYQTVETDGYYDATTKCHHCWERLVNTPLKFIEFCDFESDRHPLMYILKKHGCYRLTKVKRNTEHCHTGIDEDIAKIVIEPYVSFRKNQCITVEHIDKPKARYKYSVDARDIRINEWKGILISRAHLKIEDMNKGELIAGLVSYSLTPGGAGTPQSKPVIGCDSIYITGKKTHEYKGAGDKVFIDSVLKVNN